MESAEVKRLKKLTGGWLIWLAALAVFWWYILIPFGLPWMLLSLLCLIAGVVLIVWWLFVARRQRVWKLAMAAILVVIACAYAYAKAGETIGLYARFLFNQRRYEAKVGEILRLHQTQPRQDFCNQNKDCEINWGPPLLVLFLWDGQSGDYFGIVYDATGTVQRMDVTPKRFSLGMVEDVRHLSGPWYFCRFFS